MADGVHIEHTFPAQPRKSLYPLLNGNAVDQQLGYVQDKAIIIYYGDESYVDGQISAGEGGGYTYVPEESTVELYEDAIEDLYRARLVFRKYSAS